MKKSLSILLILLISCGFIISLHSSYKAMGEMAGSVGCAEHCLINAAPYLNQNTIIPIVGLLIILLAVIFITLKAFNQPTVLNNTNKLSSPNFNPYYLFKTVILRE